MKLPSLDTLPSEKKIKVLIGAHIGFPVGGISKNYEALLESDLRNKVDLHFFETSKGTLTFDRRGQWKVSNYLSAGQNIISFFQALFQAKPDLVHIGTAYGPSILKHGCMVLISRALGIKVILQLHFSLTKLYTNTLADQFIKFFISKCSAIVVISKEWLALCPTFPDTIFEYIPNAIDTKPFLNIPRSVHTASPINILYLGHLGRDKGIYELIEAVPKLRKTMSRKFVLNLYGESLYPNDFEAIESLIENNGLTDTVLINKPVYGAEKLKAFTLADLFILPSHHEGMPISILEAMAAGLPVIATTVGGIPEQIVNYKTGLLVPSKNADALAIALKTLIEADDVRIEMGLAGRERVCRLFDIDQKANKLFELYSRIM